MAGVNKVILVGNLGANPEVRYTAGGQPVANLRLATTEKWVNKNGEKSEITEWHRVVAWGKLAETCGQYLQKGKQIYVEGRLQTRSWEDRETGQKKYRTEVICNNFQMLGKRGDFEGGGEGGGYQAPAPSNDVPDSAPADDDDIPF